jgi:hypothetical protein
MINYSKLHKELSIALPNFTGLSDYDPNIVGTNVVNIQSQNIRVIFTDTPSAGDIIAMNAIVAAHNPNPTAAELADIARKEAAPENLKRVMELNDLIPNQAAEWLERQVHAGKKKSELLAEISGAGSYSALKAPMLELAEMIYQSTEANKKIVRLLVAVKDLYS